MNDLMLRLLESLGLAYWIKIQTENPNCIYYFGPFASQQEAQEASSGYIEDLKEEGTQGITVIIDRMKPQDLTVFDDETADSLGETRDHERFPALSGQLL